MTGKVVQIFIRDINNPRYKKVEIINWTGYAISLGRSQLKNLQNEKMSKIGVYILIGGGSEDKSFYVGESEDIIERMKQHLKKEFWNEAILFTSKDENLTKAHIKYLEFSLYDIMSKNGSIILENSNIPKKSSLPEPMVATMDEFLKNILLMLSVLGYPGLEKIENSNHIKNDTLFYINNSNADAIMKVDNGFYTVLSGSILSPLVRSKKQKDRIRAAKQRDTHRDKGLLETQNEKIVLKADINFISPSGAAVYVHGRSSNGRTEWKTKSGMNYHDWELSQNV